MEETIIIKDLNKEFYDPQRGTVKAVNNVSFSAYKGEVFGLLGPNGAGKTTTLRMMATLMQPDSGNITIAGFDTAKNPENVRRSIGYMSSNTALYPRLSPREIIRYFAELNDYPEKELTIRVEQLISYFRIGEYADTYSEKLSTGMKQITSIARTIVHNPPVLILDEPSSGLDVIVSQKIHSYIKDLRDQGKTIIFSSHNMGEVEKICDRIGIINNGKLLTTGTVEDLREQTGEFYMENIFIKVVNEFENKIAK
ncbi:MAG: ATP-binding cassette domain-containing protein [Candidatus Delongbacteria bacterium]|jgi:sodium transport system ATP-binding protein|nr:ATP-binding cassette domain-containing protein [Candidatus Delongbacteria bacterium]MDY0017527.1 ATP-binding cassette domain-containing protein [Candidatus Delongbacteria bacterium]